VFQVAGVFLGFRLGAYALFRRGGGGSCRFAILFTSYGGRRAQVEKCWCLCWRMRYTRVGSYGSVKLGRGHWHFLVFIKRPWKRLCGNGLRRHRFYLTFLDIAKSAYNKPPILTFTFLFHTPSTIHHSSVRSPRTASFFISSSIASM